MNSNEIFHGLKTDRVVEKQIDAMAATLGELAMAIDASQNNQACLPHLRKLEAEVQALRAPDLTFANLFSGNGPIARQIIQAARMDQILHGEHSAKKRERISEIVAKFNHEVSYEPHDIYEVSYLVRKANEEIALSNTKLTPLIGYEPVGLSEMVTGFYTTASYAETFGHIVVLAGEIQASGVKLVFFASTVAGPQLYAHHPQEDLWTPCDLSCVIPGMVECLTAQLEIAHESLRAQSKMHNWPQEFEAVAEQANSVLNEAILLPHRHGAFRRWNPQLKEIRVRESGYTVLFQCSSGGTHPCRAMTVFQGHEEQLAFTVRFSDLVEETQQRIMTTVQRELDSLTLAIESRRPATPDNSSAES